MDRDLEKFRGGPNLPAQSRMRVTIGKTNVLSFNKNAFHELGKPPGVYLYFSRIRDLIVVEPVSSLNFTDAFPILTKGRSGYRINAVPFCRNFGIRLDHSLRFISPEIRDGNLELKLANTVSVAQVRRRKKKNE